MTGNLLRPAAGPWRRRTAALLFALAALLVPARPTWAQG